MLLGGRSSSAFLVEPGWDDLTLVRLAPSEGPSLGNRAHLALPRGDRAPCAAARPDPGWSVADDEPPDPRSRGDARRRCARTPRRATGAW